MRIKLHHYMMAWQLALLLTCLSALMPATHSHAARIGETMDECIRRYGPPATVNAVPLVLTFRQNGFAVVAEFSNSRCSSLLFIKLESDVLGEPRELSTEETNQILFSQSTTSEWRKLNTTKEQYESWQSEDNLCVAFQVTPDMLVIATRAAWERPRSSAMISLQGR